MVGSHKKSIVTRVGRPWQVILVGKFIMLVIRYQLVEANLMNI